MGWFWSNDKDKDKKKKKDGKEDSPIIKITHDDASTNRGFQIDTSNMASWSKVDIWAFGVCLFIMANDKEPFKCGKAEEEKQMLSAQLEKKWTLRSRTEKKYSPNYKDLLDRMLEPDLDRRITVNGMAKHPWITTDLSPNRT